MSCENRFVDGSWKSIFTVCGCEIYTNERGNWCPQSTKMTCDPEGRGCELSYLAGWWTRQVDGLFWVIFGAVRGFCSKKWRLNLSRRVVKR